MNLVAKILTALLFIGSFPVMSYSFQVPGYEALIFGGGVLMACVAWMIPLYILPRISK
ncbi:MAG: hypothetical protein ACKOWN_03065 [Microbacteriaceae bacterium]